MTMTIRRDLYERAVVYGYQQYASPWGRYRYIVTIEGLIARSRNGSRDYKDKVYALMLRYKYVAFILILMIFSLITDD
jgi:hypothetical protein